MQKLDKEILQRIKAVANELSRSAFAEHKRVLTAECLKMMETGGDIDGHLEAIFLEAQRSKLKTRFQSSTQAGAPTRAEGKHGKPQNITVSGDPSRAEAMRT